MKYYSCCGSHMGRVRSNNEDNLNQNGWTPSDEDLMRGFVRTDDAANAFSICVCDGMGGESYGEKASRVAVEIFGRHLKICDEEKLNAFVQEANTEVCSLMLNYNARMGTTFAGICFDRENVYASNVGDSKIFKISDGIITQLSIDHTELQVMLENNVITEEQAKSGSFRNRLTQNLGIFEDEMILEPSFCQCRAKSNDRFLICSDGLTDMLANEEILNIILMSGTTESAVIELIRSALKKGGKDNVTLALTQCIS